MRNKKINAYITHFEKEILVLAHSGISFENIAKRHSLEISDVNKLYHVTMKKISLLQHNCNDSLAEYDFVCKDMQSFLDRMGMNKLPEDTIFIVKSAILISKEHSELLDSLLLDFYPKLANEVNMTSCPLVARRLRNAFEFSFAQKTSESRLFSKKFGIEPMRDRSVKVLLSSAVKCIHW